MSGSATRGIPGAREGNTRKPAPTRGVRLQESTVSILLYPQGVRRFSAVARGMEAMPMLQVVKQARLTWIGALILLWIALVVGGILQAGPPR